MSLAAILMTSLLCLGLTACDASQNAKQRSMLGTRNPVVEIKFSRSGGIAGPLTNVGGTVNLTDQGGEVVSNNGNYRRDLDPHEVEQLRALADPSGAKPEAGQAPVPDAFQYHVSVTTKDGKTHDLTLPQAAGNLRAVSQGLADWLQEEASRILAHRVQAAKH